jgi:1-pyrroline-5-carboxylate dehydrogenase
MQGKTMTTDAKPRLKITYATLRNDNEELHALYEAGLTEARGQLGGHHPNLIGGKERAGESETTVHSPIDHDIVLGHFATGTRQDVRDAIAAARAAQPAWAATPWRERLAIIRRAAELISQRQMVYGGLMAIEVGKSRLEALGEVEEAADLLRYYSDIMERNEGYDHPMDNLGDAAVHTRSIMRPMGVFAVISPFNFPMALCAGPTAAALIAGNTVVFKPSSTAPMSGINLVQAYRDAGLPEGTLNLVMGPGDTVGQELQENPGIDGIVFTGSFDVGFQLFRTFSTRYPRPAIVEMGGKNPAIVTARADLEEAAEGIVRSAFGFSGQKCSANSRVYVERPVHDELIKLLVEKAEALTVGDPLVRSNWMGPVIDQRAVDRHQQASAEARRDGTVFTGGERLTHGDLERGFYVEPTVVGNLPSDHRLFVDELFAPFTAVAPVDSLDEAIRLSNESVYGLTAGIFSEDPAEVQQFLDTIETGTLYVNRRAGATTGAWPGVQAFGGWKGSGSTGKAGLSMYYVAQFLREQSHTVVD